MARLERIKLTYDDYRSLPDDGKRYEILDGELAVSPSCTLSHQRIVMNLLSLILDWLKEHPVGQVLTAPLDVILSDMDIVQPDIIYVSNERLPDVAGTWLHGAPDLVIEVLSPSTRARDLTVKRQTYARFGVREYWTVDPEARTVTIWKLSARGSRKEAVASGDRALESALLPGLKIVPGRVFRGS